MRLENVRPVIHQIASEWVVEPPRLKKGGLVQHAEMVRGAGRHGDTHLVHLNDDEIAFLENKWGPGTINPKTGLREYFLSDLWNGVKSVMAIAQPVVDVFGSLFGNGSAVSGTGYGSGSGSAARSATLFGGGSGGGGALGTAGNLGDLTLFNLGRTPISLSNIMNLAGTGASIYGALRQNQEYQKQQKRLQRQWEAQQAKQNATQSYDIFSDQPQVQLVGLAPTRPSELAGFGPEQPLVAKSTQGMSYGGVPGYSDGGFVNALDYAPGGQVSGPGDGQDDRIPAYLSRDEYVLPADVISHLGNGSSNAGARRVDAFVDYVRKTRTGNRRFPPRADGALRYLMGSPTESELGRD
jgi:hypothetical protein